MILGKRTYAIYYTKDGYKNVMLVHGCASRNEAVQKFYTIMGYNAFIFDIRRQ